MSNLHKVTNNAIGLVQNNPLTIGGTNLIVDNALDTKLNAMGGFKFWLTLWHIATTPDTDASMEIVEVTARVSPNNYTITRAQQGTAASAFIQNSNVALLWTKGNAHEVLNDVDTVAQGTIIVYGSDFLPHLLPAGADGTRLQADSSVATIGLKWATGSGASLGVYSQPITIGTPYHATTDGFVIVTSSYSGASGTTTVKTDSSSTPTTVIASIGTNNSVTTNSATVPVRNGDYVLISITALTGSSAYWIPLS